MKNAAQFKIFCENHAIDHKCDVPLSELSTFRIGGPASVVVWPRDIVQISRVTAFLYGEGVPYCILGRGSNVLFRDEGFHGAVIVLGQQYAGMRTEDDGAIFCESGAKLSHLCRYALEHGLTGLEFAYGIPGSVGGAVYMNAGAYGGEMKDVLLASAHLHPNGEAGEFHGEAMRLSYRHSAYTDSDLLITGAYLRLRPGNREEIQAKMEECLYRRRDKQPLEYPSAGSTFKRPEGNYASALIDQCGLKGRRVGGAAVSTKHAGFVVNLGGATCRDVLALIELIQREVLEKTGYELHSEVKVMEEQNGG